jgi:superoxide dismutase
VTKEQRQSSKAIVFGNIYGMGLRSLAAQIKKAVEEAEAISKKFFGKFVKAKGWLDWAVSHTGRKGYVYSPLGRRRNLQGYAVPVKALRSAMERRGMNSPIQGMGSDFGFIGSNEYTRAIDQFITDNGIQSNAEWFKDKGYYDSPLTSKAFLDNPAFAPIGVNSMVHDSIKTQVRYDLIYIALHLKEWAMIRGVREYVKDRYGFNFNVDLAIEFEVGCSSDTMTKWLFNNQTVEVEFNGMRMHEYYFEQFENGNVELNPDSNLAKVLIEKYESIEGFIKHFKAVSLSRGIGWTILAYDPIGKTPHVYWVSDHELGQLAGLPIILALDMWEHAFMADYMPAEKIKYVDAFLNNINWQVIEDRFNKI